MTQPSFTQTVFRLRNDDGNETGATWKQSENVNDTIATGVNFRVRFTIDETASRTWSKTFNLYYSQNGGSYAAVSGSTPVQFSASSNFADGDDCTNQLTAPSGTFLTNNNGMKETTGGNVNAGGAGQFWETEWCLTFDNAQVADGDTIGLRIYDSTSPIASYTNTPSITVSAAKTVSKSDGITLGESQTITNSQLGDINVSDGLTIGESVARQLDISINVLAIGNGINLDESATVQLPQLGDISKSDGLTIGESVSLITSDPVVSVTDSLTIGESKTLESAVNVSKSDGITLGDTLSYYTEEIILSESVIVVLTEAPVEDREISKTDGLTIGESVSLINTLTDVSISNGITLGESNTQSLSSPTISGISDNITLGDTVTVTLPDALVVSVTDGLTVGESQTVAGLDERIVNVTDNVTIGEPEFSGWGTIETSATDAITLGESQVISGLGEYVVNVTDSVTLGESQTVANTTLSLTVTDGLTITDTLTNIQTTGIAINVTDSIILGESQTVANTTLYLTASDGIALGESQTITNTTLYLTASDGLTIGESRTVTSISEYSIGVTDGITLGDTGAIDPLVLRIDKREDHNVDDTLSIQRDSFVNKTDGLTLGESTTITKLAITVNVSDSVDVEDQSTTTMTGTLVISKTDGITVGESQTVTISALIIQQMFSAGNMVNVEDIAQVTLAHNVKIPTGGATPETVNVNDSVVVVLGGALNPTDAADVNEIVSVTTSNPQIHIIATAGSTISVDDTASVLIPELSKSVSDDITLGESTTVILSETGDIVISITDNVKLNYGFFVPEYDPFTSVTVSSPLIDKSDGLTLGESTNVGDAYHINVTDRVFIDRASVKPVTISIPSMDINKTDNVVVTPTSSPGLPLVRVVIVSPEEINRTDDLLIGEEVYLAVSTSPIPACCQAWDEAYYSVVIGDELYYRADAWDEEYYRVEIGDKDCGK